MTIGLLEAAAAGVYYWRYSEQERNMAELAVGLKASGTSGVLRYTSHPYFNYVLNPDFHFDNGYHPHAKAGFRGESCCAKEKLPGQIRIIAVGGSTTYGAYFTYEGNVWPALVGKKLSAALGTNIEVINAGVPNYTSYELIGLLAMQIPEFSPDIVLIHTGLNDAFTAGYQDEGGPDNTSFRHTWSHRPLSDWMKSAMKMSYLLRLFGLRWVSSQGSLPGDMNEAMQYPPPPDVHLKTNARMATGKYFRRNLQTLVALCRNMNAIPVLVNEPFNPAFESGQDTYRTAIAHATVRNNDLMKEVAERNRLIYIDLYSKMRNATVFVDAAHENGQGMEIKATEITRQLMPFIKTMLRNKNRP